MNSTLPVLNHFPSKKIQKFDLTTRFLNGKMLMFSKVSIKSFVYDIIDVFMFPNKEIKKIYQKYKINKCLVEQNLTDTDSTSIFFVFICDLVCDVREDEARDIIFAYDQSQNNYNPNKEIRIKTSILRSDLCDFNDAYIVVKGNTTFIKKTFTADDFEEPNNTAANATATNNANNNAFNKKSGF